MRREVEEIPNGENLRIGACWWWWWWWLRPLLHDEESLPGNQVRASAIDQCQQTDRLRW